MDLIFLSTHEKDYIAADQHRIQNLEKWIKKKGIDSEIFYMMRQTKSPLIDQIYSTLRLIKYIKRKNPFFIHVYSYIQVILLAFFIERKRIIYDLHGLRSKEILLEEKRFNIYKSILIRKLELTSAKLAGACVTVSKRLANYLLKTGKRSERICIIRNGVDPDLFKLNLNIKEDGYFRIGYAGGFQPWQSIDLLIEAAIKLAYLKNIRWRLIGLKKNDNLIKNRILSLNIPNFELYDFCDRIKLNNLLRECNVLIIPRRKNEASEVAFPTKFAEFLAIGKPVIVFDIDETAEIIKSNNCGFICEPASDKLAEFILHLLDIPNDKLQEMGIEARNIAEKEFSWDKIASEYISFIEYLKSSL